MELAGLQLSWRQLCQQIARMTRRDDAEDLLHSSFVRMMERQQATAIVNAEAFLVRSALNQARDDYRRSRHPAAPGSLEAACEIVQDPFPLQDEACMARERLARVKAGIAQLSPRTREIFLMHRLDGMKYREIADVMDISVSAVEKHVAKAAHFLADWAEGW